ncbi:MAG: SdiA-regulated domain-containing protein [Longimicrobiales bacterium]
MRPLLAVLTLLGLHGPAAAQAPPPLGERYRFDQPQGRWRLPNALEEISGLATAPDGRLFGHGDEVAVIFELDPTDGSVVKRFRLGNTPAPGDFEGLAIVGDRFFLITSRGWLYETREADDDHAAPYRVTDTGLGASCEVEGLAHDPATGSLLAACKEVAPARPHAVLPRIPLDPASPPLDPLIVPWSALTAFGVAAEWHPSGVEVEARSGRILVVAARQRLLVELDRAGRVLGVVELPRSVHRQPEGVAFGTDGSLFVADEGDGRRARLTVYPPAGGDR